MSAAEAALVPAAPGGDASVEASAVAPAEAPAVAPAEAPGADALPVVAVAPDALHDPDTVAECDLDRLEAAIGVAFGDRSLLLQALAHRSWCAEQGVPQSNERLEFLGDSVLGLAVTSHVYAHYPRLPEGQLSEVRAGVVNARVLAEVAREIGLGRHLLLGKGEHAGGGRDKASILSDAFEAVIAAVYLDQGFAPAEALILRLFEARIAVAADGPGGQDSKTRLQEYAASHQLGRPRYMVRDEGPDHAKRFFATVILDGEAWGMGEGRSKKEAEQAAALDAFGRLRTGEPLPAAGGDEDEAGAMGGDDEESVHG